MSKIKEIHILTTDKSWWRMMVNDISATKDETIANVVLAQTSVSACRIWFGADDREFLDGQVFINTANIIAIEVIREREE